MIEASEPVAYVATRPDPLTLALDFRNVASEGVANSVAAAGRARSRRVSVEDGESLGAPVARVRIALAQPVAHHVRSDRNTIVIEFDKPETKAPYVLPPPVKPAPDAMAGAATGQRCCAGRSDQRAGARSRQAAVRPPSPATRASGDRMRFSDCASRTVRRRPRRSQAPAAHAAAARASRRRRSAADGPQFTGHPVSLDFQGADLRAVLRTFAEISGLNIVIDPTVQGTVDVALRDVPWDQALDIILRANKLGYLVDGTIVRIAPLTVLSRRRSAAPQARARNAALAGQLEVMTQHAQLRQGGRAASCC